MFLLYCLSDGIFISTAHVDSSVVIIIIGSDGFTFYHWPRAERMERHVPKLLGEELDIFDVIVEIEVDNSSHIAM